jgi:tetratricopeptide (TPR) repeat protein
MQSDYDNSLQSYFTDMERPRDMFRNFVSAEKLPKRLIVFHGVGGVGKSSLLRMFRLHCKSENIPVALASGDEAKSVLDIVTQWTEDLKGDGIKFSALNKTLASYRAIQAKVEDQVKKSQNKVADIASKAASKTAETAGGALLGAAIGSVIPGVGTAIGGALGSVVSGMGAEALVDWLREFLTKPDIDLLRDPAKKLSEDFLEDIAKTAEKKRIVLLLDTFEQMSALEDWVGETAQKIHPNVLMVIAGRKLPDWNRVWSSWMMNAQVEELKPMTEGVMRELIHRYYATMRGGQPDSVQVEAIIRFARGLPMVVTSAVQLWVKYGVEDFQSVKAEIVANLVDRLMEGVPSALIPALEAAAVVRWFDQPILRAVINKDDVREVYNELRRFPFVRTRAEGLALHDSVREMMDENLRVQDSERHTELHERAAVYFEKRLQKVTGEEAERMELERLYHRVLANKGNGIQLFQATAENFAKGRLTNRLRALLNDASTYLQPETDKRDLWLPYYNARLSQLEAQSVEASEMIYRAIGEDEKADRKLRAYALCDWGQLLSHYEKLGHLEGVEKAISVLEKSLKLAQSEPPIMDSHLVRSFSHLARVYGHERNRLETAHFIEMAEEFYELTRSTDGLPDIYGLSDVYVQKKRRFASMGEWRNYRIVQKDLEELTTHAPDAASIKNRTWGDSNWALALMGRLKEGEINARLGLAAAQNLEDRISQANIYRDLGLLLGYQGKYIEARKAFSKGLELIEKINASFLIGSILGFWGAVLAKQGETQLAVEHLTKSMEMKNQMKDPGIIEQWVWLGKLYETENQPDRAERSYELGKDYHKYGIYFFASDSLTGLVRVKHAKGDIATLAPLLTEAEQLAQQYEYNDHLASLRLTQGHLACENGSPDEMLAFYKKAMIYALRYNRFLLDELINGRSQETPLRPIIPCCLKNSEGGRKILSMLLEWWITGVNDIGTPRPDTISPIPEGVPLLEAEKLAREREPGDGSIQKSVVEQFEAAINK